VTCPVPTGLWLRDGVVRSHGLKQCWGRGGPNLWISNCALMVVAHVVKSFSLVTEGVSLVKILYLDLHSAAVLK
jgi:hypothetical protein